MKNAMGFNKRNIRGLKIKIYYAFEEMKPLDRIGIWKFDQEEWKGEA